MMEIQNSISLVNIIPQIFCKCITFQDLHMVMNQKLYWIMNKEKKKVTNMVYHYESSPFAGIG